MKTEREIYLKPLTLREQVAMEQGICLGSVSTPMEKNPIVTAKQHDTGFDSEVEGKTFETTGWE